MQMQVSLRPRVTLAAQRTRCRHIVLASAGPEPSTSGRQQAPQAPRQQQRPGMMLGPNGRPLIMGPEGQPVEVGAILVPKPNSVPTVSCEDSAACSTCVVDM